MTWHRSTASRLLIGTYGYLAQNTAHRRGGRQHRGAKEAKKDAFGLLDDQSLVAAHSRVRSFVPLPRR